jgi:hypothetical protein
MMKKRLIKIMIWLLIFVGILGLEAYNKNSEKEVMVSVVQIKNTMEKGATIKKENISFIKLPESYYDTSMFLGDVFKENLYLNTKVYKGGYLLNEQVTEEDIFKLKEDERLITVKCNIVQSNAWQSQLFDRVDLLMVGNETTYKIEDAVVYQRYNQQLASGGLPEYYVFIVDKEDANFYYEHLKASETYLIIK